MTPPRTPERIATCLHTPRHWHGTPRGYRCGCACFRCMSAAAKQRADSRADADAGRPRLVDAAAVISHIRWLATEGISGPVLAVRADVPYATIRGIVYRGAGCHRMTADAILAVQPGPGPGVGRYIDGTGTRRRLQALQARGHTTGEIGARWPGGPVTAAQVRLLTHADRVLPGTATRVRVVYDEMWDQEPTGFPAAVARALGVAARRRWAPPAAWDDDPGPHCIDDPAAAPDETSVDPDLRLVYDVEDALRVDQTILRTTIAARLGTSTRRVLQVLTVHHRRDILDRLAANATAARAAARDARRDRDTKPCGMCRQELPMHRFPRDARRVDGRDYRCRDCRAAQYQARKQQRRPA